MTIDERTEWLEADGLGGFASGTTCGLRSRRYHALLLTATTPPTGRMVLVNGFDAWIDTPDGTFALSSQRYASDVVHPDGASRIFSFKAEPWPTWIYRLTDRIYVTQEILVERGTGTVLLRWSSTPDSVSLRLRVRPFLSGRDYHSMHRENSACRLDVLRQGAAIICQPYPDVPGVTFLSNGDYTHAPDWYRNFLYSAERERGLDDREDLAAPGTFEWPLDSAHAEAVLILTAQHSTTGSAPAADVGASSVDTVIRRATQVRAAEQTRRAAFPSRLDRAADAYLVQRGGGRTIVAGYPWFTDWGRDTFIALRGLCLATRRLADARDILVEWAGAVSEGMLPNRFPDHGEAPEFNAVDASLWYVIAADELLRVRSKPSPVSADARRTLERAMAQIVTGYASGTRFGIRMDTDGLLAAGASGLQLTWMDARVGDRVITPRIGKPVEVQALWLNALAAAARTDSRWRSVFDIARMAFVDRFWIEERGFLADVVDVDHRQGTRDAAFRPNQIFAVGGLPLSIVDDIRAERIVAAVESRLVTPLGLRSLARGEPGYAPRYEGDGAARDAVYHQGTVWPWLMGAFIEAWVRVRGGTDSARAEARHRFFEPLLHHLDEAGIGHISEIADAEAPFTPRGCPFQAWSLGELLRIDRLVLASNKPRAHRARVPDSPNEAVDRPS